MTFTQSGIQQKLGAPFKPGFGLSGNTAAPNPKLSITQPILLPILRAKTRSPLANKRTTAFDLLHNQRARILRIARRMSRG